MSFLKSKIQMGLFLSLAILLFGGLVAWTASEHNSEQISHTESQARLEQASMLSQLMKIRLQNYQYERDHLFPEIADDRFDGNQVSDKLQDSSYVGLAELKRIDSKSWGINWFKLRSAEFEYISSPQIESYLNNLNLDLKLVSIKRLHLKKQKKQFFLIIEKVGEQLRVGLMDEMTFASMSRLSSSVHQNYIVNENATALVYSDIRFIGQRVNKKIIKNFSDETVNKNFSSQKTADDKTLFSGVARIAGTNLLAVSSKSYVVASVLSYFLSYLPLMLLLGVILYGVSYLVLMHVYAEMEYVESHVQSWAQGDKLRRNEVSSFVKNIYTRTFEVAINKEAKGESLEMVKVLTTQMTGQAQNLFNAIHQGIKGPITAILGHVQMIESESLSALDKENVKLIETEARSIHRFMRDADVVELAKSDDEASEFIPSLLNPSLESEGSLSGESLDTEIKTEVELDSPALSEDYKFSPDGNIEVEKVELDDGRIDLEAEFLKSDLSLSFDELAEEAEEQVVKIRKPKLSERNHI